MGYRKKYDNAVSAELREKLYELAEAHVRSRAKRPIKSIKRGQITPFDKGYLVNITSVKEDGKTAHTRVAILAKDLPSELR